MNLIIDANAAFGILDGNMQTERFSSARRIFAPDLIVPELLNTRWKYVHAKRPAPTLERVLETLVNFEIEPTLDYAAPAAMIAEQIGHPVYDCIYIALAMRKDAKLLTNDNRLTRKLRAVGLGAILA
jgi:predicted nucleic acid-binding protein